MKEEEGEEEELEEQEGSRSRRSRRKKMRKKRRSRGRSRRRRRREEEEQKEEKQRGKWTALVGGREEGDAMPVVVRLIPGLCDLVTTNHHVQLVLCQELIGDCERRTRRGKQGEPVEAR